MEITKPTKSAEDMLKSSTKEDWDERLADWPQLESVLLTCLLSLPSPENPREDLPILVPACGSSRLSVHLYDAGFLNIMNVDFSTVVITNMLLKYVRKKPGMKWRVMDMTKMEQILDKEYSAIVDKGGLTTLMEPQNDPQSCNLYISEVKRILKTGGKFICLTSAETRVLELLFRSFRFGWKTCVYGIPQDPSSTKPKKEAFVVVAEREKLANSISQISSFWNDDGQASNLRDAFEKEKTTRDHATVLDAECNYMDLQYHSEVVGTILLIHELTSSKLDSNNGFNVAILGLGSGLLPMFLRIKLPLLKIEVIENEANVLAAASDDFGFQEDSMLFVRIKGWLDHLTEVGNSGVGCIDLLIMEFSCNPATLKSSLECAKNALSQNGVLIMRAATSDFDVNVRRCLEMVFKTTNVFFVPGCLYVAFMGQRSIKENELLAAQGKASAHALRRSLRFARSITPGMLTRSTVVKDSKEAWFDLNRAGTQSVPMRNLSKWTNDIKNLGLNTFED